MDPRPLIFMITAKLSKSLKMLGGSVIDNCTESTGEFVNINFLQPKEASQLVGHLSTSQPGLSSMERKKRRKKIYISTPG